MNAYKSIAWRTGGYSVALLVVIGRILTRPVGSLWRDWPLILAVYFLYALAVPEPRRRPVVTLMIATFLLGIYVCGQFPYTLAVMRGRP